MTRLTADQRKRLKQIAIQAMNVTVFNDPDVAPKGAGYTDAQKATMKEVAAALKLSDEQKKTIEGIADEVGKEVRKDPRRRGPPWARPRRRGTGP